MVCLLGWSETLKKFKVLDLFSGIGGFSLGLEKTGGFETVAFCEIDEAARSVLRKHWSAPIYEDVRHLMYPEFDIDVICGGFPCQDISVAGKQLGLKGERSGLWFEFKRLIKEVRPRYAIIENVANLRSKGLNQVLKDLWEIGYSSEWYIISAAEVGAPHKRERCWIIAYPNSDEVRKQPGGSEWKSGREAQEFGRDSEDRTDTDSECIGQSERAWQSLRPKEQEAIRQNFYDLDDEGIAEKLTNSIEPRLQRYIKQEHSLQFEQEQTYTKFGNRVIRTWGEFSKLATYLRTCDGISPRLDKPRRERIKQLGNAVVPQIPELIGRAILKYETES